jgi:hypothetical protein
MNLLRRKTDHWKYCSLMMPKATGCLDEIRKSYLTDKTKNDEKQS